MPQETPKNIVVVENVPEWQRCISAVVTNVFPKAKIHFASSAREALAVIDQIRSIQMETQYAVDLVLSDLHLSGDPAEDNNGDRLLRELMNGKGPVPPFAFVSGTLANPTKLELIEAMPNIPFLNKDAFLAVLEGTPERKTLIENLRSLAAGKFGPIESSPSYLALLAKLKHPPTEVKEKDAFIDEIKAKADIIWAAYRDFLKDIPGKELLQKPSLYDPADTSGIKIHDYKNELSLFIDSLRKRKDLPEGLFEKLIGLQVYINRMWQELSQKRETVDVRQLVNDICANFGKFTDRLVSERPSSRYEYVIHSDSAVVSRILIEAIQNALSHSPPDDTVSVEFYDGMVKIINVDKGGFLSFTIMNNMVTRGSLPEKSTSSSGSGQGLKMLLQNAKKAGVNVSMKGEMYSVETVIDFSRCMKKQVAEADREKELHEQHETKELGNILFICHDRTPQTTFQDVLNDEIPGFRYECVIPSTHSIGDYARFFLDNEALFLNACLCVIHMYGGESADLLRPIFLHFPHITFLPVSASDRLSIELFQLQEEDRLLMETGLPVEHPEFANVLWPQDIQEALANEKPEVADAIVPYLYRKNYPPEILKKIVEIARKKALKRKGNS